MSTEFTTLLITAATIGATHTALGPDHYLPFAALQRSRDWSTRKTLSVTALCGFGHVLGSALLGALGLALAWALSDLVDFESVRGDTAAWMLVAFGLVYLAWGVKKALRDRPHTHFHVHHDGTAHHHEHTHVKQHAHFHEAKTASLTFGGMFLIFIFGPCEALIPLLMYPAAEIHWTAAAWVVGVFTLATVGTMLLAVWMVGRGLKFIPQKALHRWSHAIAGLTIASCGALIHLGL